MLRSVLRTLRPSMHLTRKPQLPMAELNIFFKKYCYILYFNT
jgi:hypothetical protein